MSRRDRECRIRDAIEDTAIFFALRCAVCGSDKLLAVEPGRPESEPRGFCKGCWPQSFSHPREAAA